MNNVSPNFSHQWVNGLLLSGFGLWIIPNVTPQNYCTASILLNSAKIYHSSHPCWPVAQCVHGGPGPGPRPTRARLKSPLRQCDCTSCSATSWPCCHPLPAQGLPRDGRGTTATQVDPGPGSGALMPLFLWGIVSLLQMQSREFQISLTQASLSDRPFCWSHKWLAALITNALVNLYVNLSHLKITTGIGQNYSLPKNSCANVVHICHNHHVYF